MFHDWESFYILIGTGAASLIGLLFVVVTLTQGRERSQTMKAISIYMTPIVIDFAVVMTTSAVAVAPLSGAWTVVVLGAGALFGFGNAAWACIAIRGLMKAEDPPHWTDFWMYGATPTGVLFALVIADGGLLARAGWAVDLVAVLLLSLLLVGIRNAWDLITWMAPRRNADSIPL